ncbi:hypothetical protein ABOZ73_03695 [Caulobacter sp. 73W]|uniref:Aminobenzoate oxygenase n=1 Tax=Caulobacter sp. 73W TaxID=3161137 RepID=A0AB39KWD6_9CAUL
MIQNLSYERLFETSQRVNWRLEDVIGPDKPMDFSMPFLPESFARTDELAFLSDAEKLKLNHIRAAGYLAMFELVERCLLPIIDEFKAPRPDDIPYRALALAQFAEEEAKHIELFVRFRAAFTAGFEVECPCIGPAEAIGEAIRGHGALGQAIFVLGIEWATQRHYLDSVQNNRTLDPQFKSLLKHHWLEEAQHAKLDAKVFFELAARSTPEQIEKGVDDFLAIGAFIDGGLAQQVQLDLAALEKAIGRTLPEPDRERFTTTQHQALRWTFLGSALRNTGFLDAVGEVSPDGRRKLEQVAPIFC